LLQQRTAQFSDVM